MNRFEVWCLDYDEKREDVEGRPVEAYNHREAAETWAERDDRESADYSIVSGGDVVVCVAEVGSEEVVRYRVSGESVPHYHAEWER